MLDLKEKVIGTKSEVEWEGLGLEKMSPVLQMFFYFCSWWACVCFGIHFFLAVRHAFHNMCFFLLGENEVFLTKVNELERRFYLETSVVGAKYSELNYSIYTFS